MLNKSFWYKINISFIFALLFSSYLNCALIPQPYSTIKEMPHCCNPEYKGIALANNIIAITTPKIIELFDLESKKTILKTTHDENAKTPYAMSHICMALNKDQTKLVYIMAEEKPYTKEIILPVSEKSTLTVCEMTTGKILFSKKCRYGSNGVAFHPIDDNYIISYTSAIGDPSNINLLQIHPLNDVLNEYTIELKSKVQPHSNLVYFTTNTLFCHPHKSELLVMINDVWHALPNYFISSEKMFLIKTALETILSVRNVSHKILMLIRNSGSIHQKKANLPSFLQNQENFFDRFALQDREGFWDYNNERRRYCDYRVAGYSCNGKYVALVLDQAKTLVLRNTTSGFVKKLSPREREILAVGFHPNNNVVAVIDSRYKKNNITYFDIKTGKEIPISSYLKLYIRDYQFPSYTCSDSGFLIRQLVFSENGLKAYVIDDNQLMCFDIPQEIIDFKQNKPKKVSLTVPDEIVKYNELITAETTQPQQSENSLHKKENPTRSSTVSKNIPNKNNRIPPIMAFFKNNRSFFILSACGVGSFCIGWLLGGYYLKHCIHNL